MALFEHEIVVRVLADTSGLKAGLASSAAQIRGFESGVNAAGSKTGVTMQRVGREMQNIGRSMTQFVTLPVVAGFAYATYAAIKYENSLLKVKNLTGLTAAETSMYGERILKMSGEVGVGAQKLSEAFYFIASSGFKGAGAMKVLEVSAKASAAGMGEVQTIADAVTSAMNAYGQTNLSAARATDILMKTIEVGKAEPEQLARSLGRIMPVSAQLGVSLGQVGGAIAGLTLTGLSSAEAVTALRGTMIALVAPAKMSIDEMKRVGTSYQEITGIIRDKGLLPALEFLRQKTDGNMLSMRKIIPNVRALNGVLSLLGENYKKNVEVTQKVIDSNGKLDSALAYTTTTTISKLKRAWADIQEAFIRIGQIILPTVADMAQSIGRMFESFNNMSPSAKGFILWGAAIAAALGPVIMIMGSLVRTLALVKLAFGGFGLVSAFAGIKGVVMGVVSAMHQMVGASNAGRIAMLGMGVSATAAFAAIAVGVGLLIWKLKSIADETSAIWAAVGKQIQANINATNQLATLTGASLHLDAAKKGMAELTKGVENHTISLQEGKAGIRDYIVGLQDQLSKLNAAGRGHSQTAQSIRDLIAVYKPFAAAARGVFDAATIVSVKAAQNAYDGVSKRVAAAAKEVTKLKAQVKVSEKMGLDADTSKLKAKLREAEAELKRVSKAEHKAKITLDNAKALEHARAVERMGKRVNDMPIEPTIDVNNTPAMNGIRSVVGAMSAIRDKTVTITVMAKQIGSIGAVASGGTRSPKSSASSGDYLTRGAADGINQGAAQVAEAARRMVTGALDAARAAAEVQSPSKATMRIGADVALGLAHGITKKKQEAIAAAADMAGNVLSVFESALGVGDSIRAVGEANLPTAKIAAKWAKKVGVMMKAAIKAMQGAFKGIDIGAATKGDNGKSAGWKAEAFGSVVSMAEGVASIFTAFAELTAEKVTLAIAGINAVKDKAKLVGAAIAGMVRAFKGQLDKVTVSEGQGSNADRAIAMASGIAGVLTTFATVTGKMVDDAIAGIGEASLHSKDLADRIYLMVLNFRDIMKTVIGASTENGGTDEAGNADRAMALANGVAGVITAFAAITGPMVDLAKTGIEEAARHAKELNDRVVLLVFSFKTVMDTVINAGTEGGSIDQSGNADRAFALANGVAGVITTFASITGPMVALATTGINAAVTEAGSLATAVGSLVNAFNGVMNTITTGGTGTAEAPTVDQSGNADRAFALANGVAGVITTFATITADMAAKAKIGIEQAVAQATPLATAVLDLVKAFGGVMDTITTAGTGTTENPTVDQSGNADRAFALANGIAGVITTFAAITEEMAASAKKGIELAVAQANPLADAVSALVLAFRDIMGTVINAGTGTAGNPAVDESGNADRAFSLANGIAGVITTFASITADMAADARDGMNAAVTEATSLAASVVSLVTAFHGVMNTVINAGTADGAIDESGNADRAFALANSIAGIIVTFAAITTEMAGKARDGIAFAVAQAVPLSGAIVTLVESFRGVMKTIINAGTAGGTIDEAGNAERAFAMANSVAGIITTFSTILATTVDDAVKNLRYLTTASVVTPLVDAIKAVADAVALAFNATTYAEPMTAAAAAAVTLVGNVAAIITSFAAMTETVIADAVSGAGRVVGAMPTLTPAIVSVVNALNLALSSVVIDDALAKSSEAVAKIIGEVTDIITKLGSMTEEAIRDGILGAKVVTLYAVDLGSELERMMKALMLALSGIDAGTLSSMEARLTTLSGIATKISEIIETIAGITRSSVVPATNAGTAIGQGFLVGLQSKYNDIIALAKKIARDTATALAGGVIAPSVMGGQSLAGIPSLAGGGVATGPSSGYLAMLHGTEVVTPVGSGSSNLAGGPTSVTVNFTGPIYANSPQQAQAVGAALGNSATNAAIIKLAAARRATGRNG